MGSRFKASHFLIIGILLSLVIIQAGCGPLQGVFQDPRYIYEDGAVLVRGDDQPLELTRNPQAVNVSYAEVVDFILQDLSDLHEYIARGSDKVPFVCSDFAEEVHNNAEAAGIRTGYMTIDFVEGGLGHAIDAFETTDKGLVCIDCTGQSVYSQLEDNSQAGADAGWDKVAYVVIGEKYGVLGLDKAQSPDYAFYEQFEAKWQEYKELLAAYNEEVKQYNQEIAGKVYRKGSPELAQIRAWEARLEEKEKSLDALRMEVGDARYKPLGVVKSFFIHW